MGEKVMFKRLIASLVCFTFSFSNLQYVHAQDFSVNQLPVPGTMVDLSSAYVPLMITGLSVHPENPLLMDFIVSTGNSGLNVDQVKKEFDRLIKYFLACLTIPENNQWVNLSPYEKQRIIPEDLGQTVLGQDMLVQDYLLKQLTASLIYPEKNLGKNFWDKVYVKANQMYGTTQIPVNTFNKVWILPDTAKVYEHNNTVFVVKSHLKVMLDEDYLALEKNKNVIPAKAGIQNRINSDYGSPIKTFGDDTKATNSLASKIIRQIILPAIEKEVNTGKNFAHLRQIYNSMILAVWFKKNLKQALLNQVYTDKSKVNGVNVNDPAIKEKIYKQYLQAYKKGVFNYIKEEVNQSSREVIPRKYFSGGLTPFDAAMLQPATTDEAMTAFNGLPKGNRDFKVSGLTQGANNGNPANNNVNAAMTAGALESDIIKLMKRLNLKDYRRFLTTMNMSVDTVFISQLAQATGRTPDDIVSELERIDFFKPIAYLYKMRNPQTQLKNEDFQNGSVDVTVADASYDFQGQRASLGHEDHEFFQYMKFMGQQAGNVPFAFRDGMKQFVGRVLDLKGVTENTTGFPDLLDIVYGLETNFLNKIDLKNTKYLISSGIGANEMYSRQLSEYLRSLGITWIVVNNPDHMDRIPSDATNDNTIVFEMSRSGTTQETYDFFQRTKGIFKKRVVAAVQGQLRTAGEKLAQEDKDAVVYSIADVPGYIGGRQMNRKTLMVAAPLFLALAVGRKNTRIARAELKEYFSGLYAANEELAYKNQDNNTAVILAEQLLTQRTVGRKTIQLLFSGSLKGLANEFYQLANEGAQKYVAGGYENNNLVYEYNLNQLDDVARHVIGLQADPQSIQPLFLLDKSSDDYYEKRAYAERLKKSYGLPVIVVTVDLKKGTSQQEIDQNLKTIARTSVLMQDTLVYFTYLTRQDANSNPAVKLVRELTGLAKNRIAGIRKEGTKNSDIRMTIQDFKTAMETSNREKLEAAQRSFAEEGETQVESHQDFGPMKQAMGKLAAALGISEEDVVSRYLGSITKSVMQIDIGEAANTNTAKIETAFGLSELNNQLGTFSAEREIIPVIQQRMLLNTQAERVSIGLKRGEEFNTTGSIEKELAQYLYNSWFKNKSSLDNLVLTYMERDEGNPVISVIAKRMAKSAAKAGLQTPMFFLPGRAHSGIEGLMARAQKAFNISIIYTQADKTPNGDVDIGGITVNDATYMYGISNVIRMFLGGSRGIIFEVKNADQLQGIRDAINKVMDRFDQMVAGDRAMTAEKAREIVKSAPVVEVPQPGYQSLWRLELFPPGSPLKDINELRELIEVSRQMGVIITDEGDVQLGMNWKRESAEKDANRIKVILYSAIDHAKMMSSDKAALAKIPGGIDLNSRHLNMESSGQKVNITFDPAMIEQFKRGDFSGVKIQILDVVPINLMPLLGLKEDEAGQLAKAI
jgi:hypothetical protein